MNRILFFVCFLPIFSCGQKEEKKAFSAQRPGVADVYTQAIGDFISLANKKNKSAFDTVFIGKRKNGLPDDFPEIQLPDQITGTIIQLIDPAAGEKMQREIRTRVYINLFAWLENDKAEFMFVVFSNGFEHQYDYHFHYSFNTEKNKYLLQGYELKEAPFDH